jgi:hypothetical protein
MLLILVPFAPDPELVTPAAKRHFCQKIKSRPRLPFILLIVLPALISIVVASRRPFLPLETSPALTAHSITLFFALLFNGYFTILGAFTGWNQSSF